MARQPFRAARGASCVLLVCYAGVVVSAIGQDRAPVSLADAIARAVAHHPRLAGQQLEVQAREAEAAQARRLPNPTISTDVEDLGFRAGSLMPSQTTVSVGQRFELGGKRQLRTSLAALDREAAVRDLALVRTQVERQVAQAFIRLLAADADLALVRDDAERARDVASAVAARVVAGVAAPPEFDRAEAVAAAAEVLVLRAEADRGTARTALAASWGGSPADAVDVTGDFSAPPTIPDLAEAESGLEQAPAIARWMTERARLTAAVDTIRASRVPDLDVAAGYRRLHDVGRSAWVVGLNVSWPVFDTQRDRASAASLRVDASSYARAAALVEIREALSVAHASAVAARTALRLLEDRVVPLTQRAYTAVLEGYQAGRFSLIEVLDARSAFTAARRERVSTLAQLHQHVITIQTLLGRTPVVVPSPTSGDRP